MTNETPQDKSLLSFPCDFTFKIFGVASDEFEATAFGIIRKYAPDFSDTAVESRLSKEGKYCALSITIHAVSKDQLDEIYRELSSSPKIVMVL